MTDKALDEARQKLANIRAHLEAAQTVLQLSDQLDDPQYAAAKAKALKMLQEADDSAQALAIALGDVPDPVRH